MRPTFRLCLLTALIVFAVASCSEDSTAPVETQSTTGMLEGEIGTTDFEITLGAAGDNRRRFEGPFVLRGSNLHYVDSLAALVVDLSLSNSGEVAHAEPVALTFLSLLPEGVTVLNPDNGINGEGASVEFAFANDDGRWTPGETSLPRRVEFGVAAGQAIAFVARLDIGEPIDGGTIAGRVWNDADQDSVIDDDEEGIPGVRIVLSSIGDDDTTLTDSHRTTRTDHDGNYAFHRLPAGVYVVSKAPNEHLKPTTPTEITVLLVETEGDVSDFLDANFGCVRFFEPPGPFPVGVFIEVEGAYATDPDRVVGQEFDLERCGNHPVAADEDDGDDNEKDCRKGILRGPVTAVDEEGNAFAIMGTWVIIDPAKFAIHVEVGQRLDVRVHHVEHGGALVADEIQEWHSHEEQVHGRIDEVEIGHDGVVRLRVLNTLVIFGRDKSEG